MRSLGRLQDAHRGVNSTFIAEVFPIHTFGIVSIVAHAIRMSTHSFPPASARTCAGVMQRVAGKLIFNTLL
jgi:hypothetical protein